MSATNRYLEGVTLGAPLPRGQWKKTLALWVLLVIVFVAVYNLLGDAPPRREVHRPPVVAQVEPPLDPIVAIPIRLSLAVVFIALSLRVVRSARRLDSDLAAADVEIAEGRYDVAIDRLRTVITKKPVYAAYALTQMGLCAERRADFAEADELYGLSRERYAPNGKPQLASAVHVARIDARRAFVRIAAGRLDEGAVLLNDVPGPEAHPDVHAHRVRAEALLLMRRGDHAAVVALVDRERSLLESALSVAERALVETLYAAASGATALRVHLEADDRRLVAKALPSIAALVEAA